MGFDPTHHAIAPGSANRKLSRTEMSSFEVAPWHLSELRSEKPGTAGGQTSNSQYFRYKFGTIQECRNKRLFP